MAQRTVEDQPDLTIPEDTIVRAQLKELKDKTIEWTDKQTREKKSAVLTEWWWEVTTGQYEGRKVKGECDAGVTNHPRNRFRLWAEALLDRELDAEMAFDDEDLIGLSADLTVKHRHYEKNGEQRVIEEVDEVIPISGSSDIPF
jgi:hypothetical protein